jgi:alpha,alpha-trehalose phosphorylase
MPEIARHLLEYRCHTLPRARRRAREMSHSRGALFAWRTINGSECSANPPTGTAQYHINADIAHAVKRYYEATGDTEFMLQGGVELLCETARLWYDLGAFIPTRDHRFCINGVTGPDEYTTLVNNNTYTNLMARENLWFAAEMVEWMAANYPDPFQRLQSRIALHENEPRAWTQAADEMMLPQAVNVGTAESPLWVMPQDDSFLYKPVWPLAEHSTRSITSGEPLLLKHHPLVYNRYQVCKQADLILAEFMLGHLPIFPREQKRRDFDYYEKVTTHDSSLSQCIFSIMATELAETTDPDDPYLRLALQLYEASATIDLDNHRDETYRGIHAANMGGSWMGIVFGFAQMRTHHRRLAFSPVLPPGWSAYAFQVFYQGRRVQIQVGPGYDAAGHPKVALQLLQGKALDVTLYGEMINLPGEGESAQGKP